ncbi:MAG: hypothetical protein WA979_02045 [Pacificimonas sp.]
MTKISGMTPGSIEITEDTEASGMIGGDATVHADCTLKLSGMLNGDLIVKAGATAIVTGMVNGTIINEGGKVELTGMAKTVSDSGAGAIIGDGFVASKVR